MFRSVKIAAHQKINATLCGRPFNDLALPRWLFLASKSSAECFLRRTSLRQCVHENPIHPLKTYLLWPQSSILNNHPCTHPFIQNCHMQGAPVPQAPIMFIYQGTERRRPPSCFIHLQNRMTQNRAVSWQKDNACNLKTHLLLLELFL